MAVIPEGGDRSGNVTIPTPPGDRSMKRTLDGHQEDMKARNRAIADVARVRPSPNPGAPIPGGTPMPAPFKVRMPG